MANRLATSGDVSTYAAATGGAMTVNDYIIDTPQFTSGGRGFIYYTNIASVFSGIRFGGTIWFDASTSTIATLYNIEMHNNGTMWTGKSDIDNPIRIRPMNGQVKILMSSASNTSRMWLLGDIPNVEINGYLPDYPGMKYPWSGPLTRTFGFYIGGDATLNKNPFQIMIDGDSDMGLISIKNIEAEHGYCVLRVVPGNTNMTVTRFVAERLYLHDTIDGEMFYVGQTTGTPFVKFDEVIIRDVLCIRAGAEAIQLQHLLSNATRIAVQENFVIWGAAAKWKFAFQQFQDSGLQWLVDEGRNILRNGIIDGWANTGLFTLSSTAGSPNSEPAIVDNVLLNDGRDIGMYTGVVSNGVTWMFRNLYFRQFNNTYNELTESPVNTFVISENSSDPTNFINITWDNTKSSLFQNSAVVGQIIGTQQDNAMEAPAYLVPPFKDRDAEQFEQWSEEYPSWSGRAGDKTSYLVDDIVACWISSTSNAGSYRFYNCISGHTSSVTTRPDLDPTKWELITWDESGVPSYHVDWESGDTQTFYPWDDFRLAADSYWNLKGMGLKANEANTAYSTFQWYIADDSIGTGSLALAGQNTRILRKSTEDVGRYARLEMKLKTSTFTETLWVTSWILLT